MKEIVTKLTTYNIFNYLFPGVLYAFFIKEFFSINIIQKDLLIGFFVYYFIGSVISRIGSIFIERVLKKINFIKFVNYSDFISASQKDSKIKELSEQNNMYRTLLSLFFCLLITKLIILGTAKIEWLKEHLIIITLSSLFLIFLFAYKKQTKYVTDRILTANNK